MIIIDVKAREILDSRGFPTVECEVVLEDGSKGVASVPSGASTGSNEALELRDGGSRYKGKGVLTAVSNINEVYRPLIINKNFDSYRDFDKFLIATDGTENKEKYGANAILGLSLAFVKACASSKKIELYQFIGDGKDIPTCMLNILNGGMHADNGLDFQEFMIVPHRNTMKEQLQVASEVFHTLKSILKDNGYHTNVGDEGGFAPQLKSNKEALDMIMKAIVSAGYVPSVDVSIALDVAASSFYNQVKDCYIVDNQEYSVDDMINMFKSLVVEYPIISIEDPLDEHDFLGFARLTNEVKVQIVGDDLFTTNVKLLRKGIEVSACNAILIKANQIGTVSETIDAIMLAKENGYRPIISHRSGETMDTFIADFAVGLSIPMIKTGSISRGERICKYNRLMFIEEQL